MAGIEKWLDDYGQSHQNPVNKAVHWICVPAIVFSLIGLLWSLPVPTVFTEISSILNWGTLFLMASIVYYFILSTTLALGMVIISAGVIYALAALDALSTPLWQISAGIFVIAWIGQFIGHMVEGKRPSFFEDLQFLMIGPVWLLSFIYRRLGIPY